MKKKGVPSNKIRFAFIIAILIGIFFLLRFISLRPFQKGNTSETYKTVISKKLHFQIAVPTTYGYFEKNASLHVTHGDDEIIITNSGRMFDSLDKELKFLSKHNDITIEKIAMIQPDFYKLKITGNHSKKEEIIYKYFSDNGMYTFEATSPGSYDVLDKIARSFHVLSTQSNTYVTPTVVPAQTNGSLQAYDPQGNFGLSILKIGICL